VRGLHTPLYLFAHFETGGFGGEEAISAIFDATSLLPTGIAFDIVVVMVVGPAMSRRNLKTGGADFSASGIKA
jgi:hypothetical protein